MSKLNSFKYKGMIFHNVKDNLFQTEKFGDKLIYKFENDKYHLVKDERKKRLSDVVVGQSEQLVCDYKYHNRDITTNGECTKCESHKWR